MFKKSGSGHNFVPMEARYTSSLLLRIISSAYKQNFTCLWLVAKPHGVTAPGSNSHLRFINTYATVGVFDKPGENTRGERLTSPVLKIK